MLVCSVSMACTVKDIALVQSYGNVKLEVCKKVDFEKGCMCAWEIFFNNEAAQSSYLVKIPHTGDIESLDRCG